MDPVKQRQAAFELFIRVFNNPYLPAAVGKQAVEHDFPVEIEAMKPEMREEWKHLKPVAILAAELNIGDSPTKPEDLSDFLREHKLLGVTYNSSPLTEALYGFCMMQVCRAFERYEGLAYPDSQGGRTYQNPRHAKQARETGTSAVEQEVRIKWDRFLAATAARTD